MPWPSKRTQNSWVSAVCFVKPWIAAIGLRRLLLQSKPRPLIRGPFGSAGSVPNWLCRPRIGLRHLN